MGNPNQIRPSFHSGILYPGDKFTLERDLSLFLENSSLIQTEHPVRGIIVPHGSYQYSGGVAARAYRQMKEFMYDIAIVIAPVHTDRPDKISVYPGSGFQTLLGNVEIDRTLADELVFLNNDIQFSDAGYSPAEFSIEAQMPFIKWIQDDLKIVPLVIGNQTPSVIEGLSKSLIQILEDKNFIIIASTDFSENHSDEQARELDNIAIGDIGRFDPDLLQKDIQAGSCQMCGAGAVITAMKVARHFSATRSKVLLYRNSGDISGNRDQVTGYCSAMIY